MNKLIFKAIFFVGIMASPLFSTTIFAQEDGDRLIGLWLPSNEKARVKVEKIGDKYYGRIVWLKEPKDENGNEKVDKNNPDESMRSVKLLGYRMLKDFVYKGKNKWEEGTIYDPENGSTYNCTITLIDDNTIDVRGYIGVSMFGRTDTWKRLQKK
ncbi:MAG: DUF2147 domain-containing protein [Flavobacteriales bacterium]